MQNILNTKHPLFVDCVVVHTPLGIQVSYHGLVIGVIEVVAPGHYRLEGMDYDRIHMAVRDMMRKYAERES